MVPRPPRPRPQASRNRSRIRSATLYQTYRQYRALVTGERAREHEPGSSGRRQAWLGEEVLSAWWSYLQLYGMGRLRALSCVLRELWFDYGLDRLSRQGSEWGLAYLQRLENVEDLRGLWGPETRERVKQVGRRPTFLAGGVINVRKPWKLVPVWMLVNLALFIVVLLAMAAQTLPRSLAGNAAASSSCRWHSVAAGETIYSISATYHLSAASVAEANHLKSYGALRPGEHLCIPLALPTLVAASEDGLVAPNLVTNGTAVHGSTQFIQFALPYAESAHQQTGWPVSMILAQWGLEHGWLVPGFTGYNWGNVGALPGVPEVASGGAWGAPAYFAYAQTPQAGVNYYVAVAGLSFYREVHQRRDVVVRMPRLRLWAPRPGTPATIPALVTPAPH